MICKTLHPSRHPAKCWTTARPGKRIGPSASAAAWARRGREGRGNTMTSLWLDRQRPEGAGSFEAGARYDAVVVGAGLTGLVTALLLARSGMQVAVLEARF